MTSFNGQDAGDSKSNRASDKANNCKETIWTANVILSMMTLVDRSWPVTNLYGHSLNGHKVTVPSLSEEPKRL